MAWISWNSLRAYQDGAASLCEAGSTIRLFPSTEAFAVENKLDRNISNFNENIRRDLENVLTRTFKKVEEKTGQR